MEQKNQGGEQFKQYAEQIDEVAQGLSRRSEAGEKISDEQRQAAVKLAEEAIATKRLEIGGSDPAARAATKIPEPQQMAAKNIAAALARTDEEPNNPFTDERLSKTYDSERSYMKYLAERAEREAQPEAGQGSAPEPLHFTHNSETATINLNRFQQTQADAEADPFGPALELEEDEQFNTIEPVQQREVETIEQLVIDEQTRERLAQMRAKDRVEVGSALGHPQEQETEASKQPQAKAAEAAGVVDKPLKGNNVESDEIFTAPKESVRPVLPPEVEREYVSVGNKYYNQKNPEVEAFEDKGNKLQTRSNSEQVASNLVKIAEARGWDEIKVSGSETFRREVWMEAAARGMNVNGYVPNEQDKATLASKVKGMAANTVEDGKSAESLKEKSDFRARENDKGNPEKAGKNIEQQRAESFKKDSREDAIKKFPELSSAYAAQAAMQKKMEADGLTQAQKKYAQQKISEKIAKSIETGKIPEVQRRQEVTSKRDKQLNEERELSR